MAVVGNYVVVNDHVGGSDPVAKEARGLLTREILALGLHPGDPGFRWGHSLAYRHELEGDDGEPVEVYLPEPANNRPVTIVSWLYDGRAEKVRALAASTGKHDACQAEALRLALGQEPGDD